MKYVLNYYQGSRKLLEWDYMYTLYLLIFIVFSVYWLIFPLQMPSIMGFIIVTNQQGIG